MNTKQNQLNKLMRRLQFWAGYANGYAHKTDDDQEWLRASAMSEAAHELPQDEWAMLRFYVQFAVFNFMRTADIKTRWHYIFSKARRDMRDPEGPNDNDLVRKLVHLCMYQ